MSATFLEFSYTLVTIALLVYFLKKSLLKVTTKERIRHWILFGFIFNFYSFSWFYTVYPLPWLKSGPVQLLGIAIVHIIISVACSLCYSSVAFHHNHRIHKQYLPLVFATTLIMAEVLRSLMMTLIFTGEDTTFGLHFTAATLGNALSTTPLIEFAYFGGVFALTFVLGYITYCTVSKEHFFTYYKHLLIIAIILFCIHFFLPVSRPEHDTVIGIVTTNYPVPNESNFNQMFKEQSHEIHKLTLSLKASKPTFIVYPEDSRYLSYLSLPEKTDLFIAFNKTLLIDGDTVRTREGFSNISSFYYPKENKTSMRGKEFLLPFNEYMPTLFRFLMTPFIGKENIDTYTNLHTFVPVHSQKSALFSTTRVATLICSEIFSYSTVHALHKEKPQLVFFQSHLQVFHDSVWSNMHLRSITKVAAAQLRTPVITSVSGAPSYIISPFGTILKTIPTGLSTTTYTLP